MSFGLRNLAYKWEGIKTKVSSTILSQEHVLEELRKQYLHLLGNNCRQLMGACERGNIAFPFCGPTIESATWI